jgi:hypothetical protein
VGEIDASAARVLAYLWHVMSYRRCREHEAKDVDALRAELRVPRSRSAFQVSGVKLPLIDERVLACWWVWGVDGESFVAGFR